MVDLSTKTISDIFFHQMKALSLKASDEWMKKTYF